MEKATPIQMRAELALVEILKKEGMRFVPMPSLNDEDHKTMTDEAVYRIELIYSTLCKGDKL